MRLVMTLKVRDEADVLAANLRFHAAQGVDFFIVTDNGSVDGTVDILRRYERAGLAHLIEDAAEEFPTPRWVNLMARLAATDFEADWVVNNDADEFWWPVAGGTLKEALEQVPERYGLVNAPRPEYVGRPDGPGTFAERLTVREAASRLQHKVAHRARPDVVVGEGVHKVVLEGEEEDEAQDRHSGRAVMRAVSPQSAGAVPGGLVPAPRWPIRILHFPVRSFEQFRRRVELLLFHGGYEARGHRADRGRRAELRRAWDEDRLAQLYTDLVADDVAIDAGLRDGSLVEDTALRDFLAGCPDPLADGVEAARAWAEEAMRLPPERAQAEMEANELDMMRSLDRAHRSLRRQRRGANSRVERVKQDRDRLADRVRELQEERDRLAAELELERARTGPLGRARALARRAGRRG